MWIELKILKNRAKLEYMISNDEDYSKILEQSKKLDKYINIKIEQEKLEKEKIEREKFVRNKSSKEK